MTLADAALIAMQWIQEAQNGRTGSRGADYPGGADPDDRVPGGAVPDGEVGHMEILKEGVIEISPHGQVTAHDFEIRNGTLADLHDEVIRRVRLAAEKLPERSADVPFTFE
jgi:hypothetical protein